jgi:hypothetical protein
MSKENAIEAGNKTPKFLSVTQAGENVLVFTLGNGKTVTFDSMKCSAEIAGKAKMHGFKQKISDTTARFSAAKDFSGAFADMADVVQSLYDGSWNRGREGGGSKLELLVAAIAQVKKSTVEKVAIAVSKATDEQKALWAKNPAVKSAMAEIVAARLAEAAEQSTDTSLDDLEV